jgi:hypothetical protein
LLCLQIHAVIYLFHRLPQRAFACGSRMAGKEGQHLVAHSGIAETFRCLDDLSASKCPAQIFNGAPMRLNKAPGLLRGVRVLHHDKDQAHGILGTHLR